MTNKITLCDVENNTGTDQIDYNVPEKQKPICSICQEKMSVIKVISPNDSGLYFYCDCLVNYDEDNDYDKEEYFD